MRVSRFVVLWVVRSTLVVAAVETLLLAGCASTARFSTSAPPPAQPSRPPDVQAKPEKETPTQPLDDDDFGALFADPPAADTMLPSADDSRLETIVAAWLGTPYRYGGMSKRGTDCSGMVFQVYREYANITLPRSSEDMQRIGRKVPVSAMQKGDLLFFHNGRRRVDHVGIYLGNDEFVHASSKYGVIKSSMKDEHYRTRFIEARRILP